MLQFPPKSKARYEHPIEILVKVSAGDFADAENWPLYEWPLICPQYLRFIVYTPSPLSSARAQAWLTACTDVIDGFKEDWGGDGEVLMQSPLSTGLFGAVTRQWAWIMQVNPSHAYHLSQPLDFVAEFFGPDVLNVVIYSDAGYGNSYPVCGTFRNLLFTDARQAAMQAAFDADIRIAKQAFEWYQQYNTLVFYDSGSLDSSEGGQYFQRFSSPSYSSIPGFPTFMAYTAGSPNTYLGHETYVNDSSDDQVYPWTTAGGAYVHPKTSELYDLFPGVEVQGSNKNVLSEAQEQAKTNILEACTQLKDYGFEYGGEVSNGDLSLVKKKILEWWGIQL